MAIYDSFDDLPPVDQLVINDEVHYSSRLWAWDGTKWYLYSDNSIGDINFKAEVPIEVVTTTTGTGENGENVDVNHFLDIAKLDELT